MTKTISLQFTLPDDIYQELKDLRYKDGDRNQEVLQKIISTVRKQVSLESPTSDFLYLIERFATRDFAYVGKKVSLTRYVADILIDGISDMEDEDFDEYKNDVYELTNRLFEGNLIDGSYTYSTYRSRCLLFDFDDDIDWDDFEDFQIDHNNPEIMLLMVLIRESERILSNLPESAFKTTKRLVKVLEDLY